MVKPLVIRFYLLPSFQSLHRCVKKSVTCTSKNEDDDDDEGGCGRMMKSRYRSASPVSDCFMSLQHKQYMQFTQVLHPQLIQWSVMHGLLNLLCRMVGHVWTAELSCINGESGTGGEGVLLTGSLSCAWNWYWTKSVKTELSCRNPCRL